MQEQYQDLLKNGPLVIGGGIAVGLLGIGLGIAILGMSSCQARTTEVKTSAQVTNIQDRIELYKWQLEQGYLTQSE